MALTLPPYLAAIRAIVPASPVAPLRARVSRRVCVNLGHGQNEFSSAGLLGLGLLSLERRPVLAGFFFGLLTYKPQMGFLLPLVLIADRQWIAFLTAAATALAMSLLSYLILGAKSWHAFFGSFELTRGYVLEQGATGRKSLQSPFSAMRMLGASIPDSLCRAFRDRTVRWRGGSLNMAEPCRNTAEGSRARDPARCW